MLKRLLLSVFLLLLLIPTADCERFEFKHFAGARYRILSVVDQAVFVNGVLSHRAETLNRISVEVTGINDDRGVHNALFQSSERIVYDSQGPVPATNVFN